MGIKNLIYLLLFFVFYKTSACTCPEIGPINKQECSRYDVIFSGKVQQIGKCENQKIQLVFQVIEAYKGENNPTQILHLNCEQTECLPEFILGEEWLIFAQKNNAQDVIFNPCSHSRKLLPDSVPDYFTEITGKSYFQDKNFLQETFPPNDKNINELKAKKYEKVNPKLIPIFLGVSLLFMLIGVLVMRYFNKRKK